VKVVCGLGNPGPTYAATRHNVGWWLIEALREAWRFPALRDLGPLALSQGVVGGTDVLLVEPLMYMNRSGAALVALRGAVDFDPAADLLVVVDDVALEAGRARLRARGSSGGNNGMKSIEAELGTQAYARLRIGVGASPAGSVLAEWVLAPFGEEDEERVRGLLRELVEGVECWVQEGVVAAGNRCNR
jgi:peptidyl-tRNA hydrolase, PTH1 family